MIDKKYGKVIKDVERGLVLKGSKDLKLKNGAIAFGDDLVASIGDEIEFNGVMFTINIIKEFPRCADGSKAFGLIEENINIPMTFYAGYIFNMPTMHLLNLHLYNCYVDERLDNFFVTIRYSEDDSYNSLEKRLAGNNCYDSVINEGNNLSSFKFKITHGRRVMRHLVNGNFNKMPESLKDSIIKSIPYAGKVLKPSRKAILNLARTLDVPSDLIDEVMSIPDSSIYYAN